MHDRSLSLARKADTGAPPTLGVVPDVDAPSIEAPKRVRIVICPYDPTWPAQFDLHKARVVEALGARALRIAHIGSTAVPGLAAKPIVDMLLVVQDSANEHDYLPLLEEVGYVLRVREPSPDEHRILTNADRNLHLHVSSQGSGEINRYLLLRGLLRTDADARTRYEAEKRRLAGLDWQAVDDYARAKTGIIEGLIRSARTSEANLREDR